ncbi:MAG: hypothetical protein NBV66_03405 [Burkholderiaceae bacterium]|nr:hypothetical protein [Burkholderiaceae bacterium]
MIWPALWNGYPLLYTDTHVFINQPTPGHFNWDKPFIYGPWMLLSHAWYSLWGTVLVQGVLLSQLVWLAQQTVGSVTPLRHLLVCLVLSLLTGASWFVSLLMPDIFSGMALLSIFILGFSNRLTRAMTVWVSLLGAFAIAVHLSHLVITAACLLVVLVLRWRRFGYAVLPLVIALVALLGTTMYMFNKVSVSPFGSVFMLARMSADGNVKSILEKYCPEKSWHLCTWKDRLAKDSDDFMWDASGPVWTHPGGPIGLAPEASEIVALAVRTRPWQVLWSATQNTVTQLTMVKLVDTIQPNGLDQTVVKSVEKFFPSAELERYKNAKQVQGTMLERVSFVSAVGTATVLLGFLLSIYVLMQAWRRRDWTALALIAMIWIGVLANAFATGGLSKPHYRYQTRIAWLLVLPPLLLWPYKKKSGPAIQSRSN